jgi:hypothetical protein
LSLGRKSYVLTLPVIVVSDSPEGRALREAPLAEALASFIDHTNPRRKRAPDPVRQRLVLEIPLESAVESRPDVPQSFRDRAFAVRGVETGWLEVTHG